MYIYAVWSKHNDTLPTYNDKLFDVIISRAGFVGLQLKDEPKKYSCGSAWCAWGRDISNFRRVEEFVVTEDYLEYSSKERFCNEYTDLSKTAFMEKVTAAFGEHDIVEYIREAIDKSKYIDSETIIAEANVLATHLQQYRKQYNRDCDTEEHDYGLMQKLRELLNL